MFRVNNIFNKLEGIFILVNTLLPITLVLLTSLGIWLAWTAMDTSVSAYKVSLHHIIDSAVIAQGEVKKSVKQVAQSAYAISEKGEDIGENINQMVIAFDKSIGNFGNTFKTAVKTLDLSIKIPVIKKNVKIPFGSVLAEPLKGVGNEIAKPFKSLSKSFAQLGNSVSGIKSDVANITRQLDELKKMDIYLDAVVREYTQLISNIDNIMHILGTLLKWIGVTVLGLIIWFSMGYIIWVRVRLKRGYALLVQSQV